VHQNDYNIKNFDTRWWSEISPTADHSGETIPTFGGSRDATSNLFYKYEITRQDTHDDINSFSNSVVDENLYNKSSLLRKEIVLGSQR
jgi:hypothetical protein